MKNIYILFIGLYILLLTASAHAGNIVVNSVAVNPKPATFPPVPGQYANVKFRAGNVGSNIPGGSGTCYVEVTLSGLDFGEAFNPATHITQTSGQAEFSITYNTSTKVIRFLLIPGANWNSLESYDYTVNRLIVQNESPSSNPTIGLEARGYGSDTENTVTTDDFGTEYTYTEPPVPMPVVLSAFDVQLKECDALISWTSKSEVNFKAYIIQKSVDGINFADLRSVPGKGNSGDYIMKDENLNPGRSYYRLKLEDKNGSVNYSRVAYINSNCANANSIKVFPNPTNANASIQLNIPTGEYLIEIIDNSGKTIRSSGFTSTGHSTIQKMEQINDLTSGVYIVKVTGTADNGNYVDRLMIK